MKRHTTSLLAALISLPLASFAQDDGVEANVAVKLNDGSRIVGFPLTESVTLETPYGTLQIPLVDIRSMKMGVRVGEARSNQAREAIALIRSENKKDREKGVGRIRSLGRDSVPALMEAIEAMGGSEDPEAKERLQSLLDGFTPDGTDGVLNDVVTTGTLTATGQVQFENLEVASSLGDLTIDASYIRTVEISLTGGELFRADFEGEGEGALRGFSTTASNNSVWGVSNTRATSGNSSVWCGVPGSNQYADNTNASITSEPIDLSGMDRAYLHADVFVTLEEGCDHLNLEVTKDGSSCTQVQTFNSNNTFTPIAVDLRQYRSARFAFRFTFTSDGSATREGCYIDNIEISPEQRRSN